MPAINKSDAKVRNSDAFKASVINRPTYFFISGTSEWEDEQKPPTPIDSTNWENQALFDLVGIKKIQGSDVVSVVPRTNWVEGTIYDQYDQNVDLINTRNPETGDFYRFYVVTEDFNVYKCLSNAYRAESIDRPTGTNPEPFRTPDGYTWKYMYSIQASDAFKFMTSNWMPCYTLTYNDGTTQWNSQQSATPGTIDNIEVQIKGTGYSYVAPPKVNIVGDGSGAEATAVVDEYTGELVDILVTDSGEGYTQASINLIEEGTGVGAEARVIVGPRYGHGKDPRIELGANYVMIKVTVDGDEGGLLQTDITYRTTGIISMPQDPMETSFRVKVDNDSVRLFSKGDTITGQTSGATADILLVDYIEGLLYLDNVVGGFIQAEPISSTSYNATPILTVYNGQRPLTGVVYSAADVENTTGNILYISNREKISRVSNQQEDLIAILSF